MGGRDAGGQVDTPFWNTTTYAWGTTSQTGPLQPWELLSALHAESECTMHVPQPCQFSSDAPLPWHLGKYCLADALAVAPLYSDTPPPWDQGKHLVWSTHPLGTVFLFFFLL